MKILQDTPAKLVLRQSATTSRVIGSIFSIGAITMVTITLIRSQGNAVLFVFAAFLAVLGVLLMLFSKTVDVTADIASRQLSFRFSSLLKQVGQIRVVSFDNIRQVDLAQTYRRDSSPGGEQKRQSITIGAGGIGMDNATWRQTDLSILCADGSVMTIASEQQQVSSVAIGVSQSSLAHAGQRLSEVLGVPFNVI